MSDPNEDHLNQKAEELLDALRKSAESARQANTSLTQSKASQEMALAEQEKEIYNKDRVELNNMLAMHRARWERSHQSIMLTLRIAYSVGIFSIVSGWIIIVAWCVLAVGYQNIPFMLSDTVLIALVTGLTTSVVGMIVIILKFFFPKGGSL